MIEEAINELDHALNRDGAALQMKPDTLGIDTWEKVMS